ncbi:MAG: rhomboid family intramembrane serine protease [Hyphomicrobiaceae bacterium]|nr:rhomboid family intramembrane serine protease [Hyphomicrobiaceae bacterium]
MFPVGDDDSTIRSTTYVTYTLVAINVLVFLLELAGGNAFIQEWSFIPARFTRNPSSDAITILTAMFMHGGWMHLFGNMLYLWIFGNNVEDRFGSIRFLIFYLVSGLAATFAQYYFLPHSNVPNVGASGAIAGVLGAYLVMFPKARVNVAIGYNVVPMPALVVLGFWIVLQLFSGVGSIATTDETMRDVGGVAYMAHIGGFFAGILLALVMGGRRPSNMA